MTTKYYKALMSVERGGIYVKYLTFCCIHETPSFAYCVPEWDYPISCVLKRDGETDLQAAKRLGFKVHRVCKVGSRFAFATREAAFEQLCFLKRRQLNHLKRDIQMVSLFLEKTQGKRLNDLQELSGFSGVSHKIESTEELVNRYFAFEW